MIYPDGSACNFVQQTPTVWRSSPAITDVIFQDGSDYYLQNKKGWRYHFTQDTNGNGTVYYQMQDFTDAASHDYTFTYNTAHRLVKVTEPAKRWLAIHYGQLSLNGNSTKTLATITSAPAADDWVEVPVTDANAYRYLLYHSPDLGYADVADIEFYAAGSSIPLTGTPISSTPSEGVSAANAFDGNSATFFEAADESGGFVGLDLGVSNATQIVKIRYRARAGYESRMAAPTGWNYRAGLFQGANEKPATTMVITDVTASDGRTVQYTYTSFTDANLPWTYPVLASATYPEGVQALYTYAQVLPGTRPLMTEWSDPHAVIGFSNGKTEYFSNRDAVFGAVRRQVNLQTGAMLLEIGMQNKNLHKPTVTQPRYGMKVGMMVKGQKTSVTDPLGHVMAYAYDADGYGFKVSQTDPLGRTTQFARSEFGNINAITRPDGSIEHFERNEFDAPTQFIDALGRTTAFVRDASNRVVSIQHPLGVTESFTYNSLGQVTAHTLPNGRIEHAYYDAKGRMTSRKNAAGDVTKFTYDAQDRVITITNPRGNVTQLNYDAAGRIMRAIHPDGTSLAQSFDAFGNVVAVTNELGKVYRYAYDLDVTPLFRAG